MNISLVDGLKANPKHVIYLGSLRLVSLSTTRVLLKYNTMIYRAGNVISVCKRSSGYLEREAYASIISVCLSPERDSMNLLQSNPKELSAKEAQFDPLGIR